MWLGTCTVEHLYLFCVNNRKVDCKLLYHDDLINQVTFFVLFVACYLPLCCLLPTSLLLATYLFVACYLPLCCLLPTSLLLATYLFVACYPTSLSLATYLFVACYLPLCCLYIHVGLPTCLHCASENTVINLKHLVLFYL